MAKAGVTMDRLCVLAATLALAGCYDAMTTYRVAQSLPVEGTELFVEAGWVSNFSSRCIVVNVYSDQRRVRLASSAERDLIMIACGVGVGEAQLSIEDGCYVLRRDYSYGGIRHETWTDEATGTTLCFRIWPKGPHGGWRPEW
jgi:hypothetical protein